MNHPGAVTRPQSCLELEDGGDQGGQDQTRTRGHDMVPDLEPVTMRQGGGPAGLKERPEEVSGGHTKTGQLAHQVRSLLDQDPPGSDQSR